MEQGKAAKAVASRKAVAKGEGNLLQRAVCGVELCNAVCEQRLGSPVDTWNLGLRQGETPAYAVR